MYTSLRRNIHQTFTLPSLIGGENSNMITECLFLERVSAFISFRLAARNWWNQCNCVAFFQRKALTGEKIFFIQRERERIFIQHHTGELGIFFCQKLSNLNGITVGSDRQADLTRSRNFAGRSEHEYLNRNITHRSRLLESQQRS
jgi:hypothetical protein